MKKNLLKNKLNNIVNQLEIILEEQKKEEKQEKSNNINTKIFSLKDAQRAGEILGIDWNTSPFDIKQFRMGINVELEHGTINPITNVTNDELIPTAKIALAHLNELDDYYYRLERMEREGKK